MLLIACDDQTRVKTFKNMSLEFYHGGVADSVIHHRIHADSHRVAGQNLFRKTFMNCHLTGHILTS